MLEEVVPESTYSETERFVPFETRTQRVDNLTKAIWSTVAAAKRGENGKAGVSWRGVPLRKDPWDMSLYPMIIWELKPRTIIELGTASGASALWMADIISAFHLDTRIISADIDTTQRKAQDSRVEFVQFDMFKIDHEPFPVDLSDLPHPWMVIEDSHANIAPLLEHFDRYTTRGDYLIVEDTLNPKLHAQLEKFMEKHGNRYRVDTHYVDNFGYNNTWNWNGFLTCVGN